MLSKQLFSHSSECQGLLGMQHGLLITRNLLLLFRHVHFFSLVGSLEGISCRGSKGGPRFRMQEPGACPYSVVLMAEKRLLGGRRPRPTPPEAGQQSCSRTGGGTPLAEVAMPTGSFTIAELQMPKCPRSQISISEIRNQHLCWAAL